MILVRLTLIFMFITWILEAFFDEWYKDNLHSILDRKVRKRMELFEEIDTWLKTISILGMMFSTIYLIFFLK